MYSENKGIILRTTKYSESSLVLDMYTLYKGRRSFIISGIRSKKSKTKAGLLQIMGLVDFVSYDRDTSSLLRIKEIKADHLYQKVPFDVLRSCLGIFLMEVCSKAIKETEINERLFEFIRSSLIKLDREDLSKLSLFHIQFLLGLSKHLGLFIQNNYSSVNCYLSLRDGNFIGRDYGEQYSMNAECSEVLSKIINKENERVPKHLRNQILDQLIQFYQYHIDNFGKVKSLEVLRTIFSD